MYERTGGHAYGSVYPGPIGAILSPQLTGIEDNASLPYASSLCGACYDVCPVKIDIPTILVHLRAEHTETYAAEHRLPSAEARDEGGRLRDEQPDPVDGWRCARAARPDAGPPAGAIGPICRCRSPGSGPTRATSRGRRSRPSATGGPGSTSPASSGEVRHEHRAGRGPGPDPQPRTGLPAAPALPYEPIAREYRTSSELGLEARVELLVDRLIDYKALVRRCSAADVLADRRGRAGRPGGRNAGRPAGPRPEPGSSGRGAVDVRSDGDGSGEPAHGRRARRHSTA